MSPPYPLCCPYPRVSVTAADLSFHSAWMTFPEMSIHPLHPLKSKRISILINYQLKEVVFSIGVSGVRGHYLKCSSLTSQLGHQSTPLPQLSSDWVSKKHSNFFFQKNLNEIIGYRVMYRCLHRTTIFGPLRQRCSEEPTGACTCVDFSVCTVLPPLSLPGTVGFLLLSKLFYQFVKEGAKGH